MNKEQTSLHIPNYLKEGDKIGLISTARKISRDELQEAIKCIESWGLEVVLGENLFNNYHQFSGQDDERTKDLQSMLDNQDIKYNQPKFEQGGIIVASNNRLNHKKLCDYLKEIVIENNLYPLNF